MESDLGPSSHSTFAGNITVSAEYWPTSSGGVCTMIGSRSVGSVGFAGAVHPTAQLFAPVSTLGIDKGSSSGVCKVCAKGQRLWSRRLKERKLYHALRLDLTARLATRKATRIEFLHKGQSTYPGYRR